MAIWFLVIIYLTFISLGLPDSLLGSAWPVIWTSLDVPFGSAGLISMIVSGGTIISSFAAGRLLKLFGTGKLTLISCLLTALALAGFAIAPSLVFFMLLAIPLGLGGGAIDAALNHYVAENYKIHHMSWLHCFWGVGATLGPIIMSFYISENNSWRGGYSLVSMIQFSMVVVLIFSLPLWAKFSSANKENLTVAENTATESAILNGNKKINVLRISGVKNTLATFLFYCGVEATVGLWGASYLVAARNLPPETAAVWVSLYFGGITVGRLINGFLSLRYNNKMLIRFGQALTIIGGLVLLLPLPVDFSLIGFILIGLGLAPVYPGLIHETPIRFGRENSARLIGYQMALAYTGTTLLPPLFGLIATNTNISLFPIVVVLYLVLMMANSEKINSIIKRKKNIALT